MSNTKLFASLFLVLAVLFAQVGHVAAAPQTQDATPLTGTVQSITTETDANGVTTVLVTLLDSQGTTQTVRVSLDDAVQLGLIDPATQQPVPLENLTEPVTIDSSQVIPDEEPAPAPVHLISQLLADFFFPDDADAMASVIDSFHNGQFEVTNGESTQTVEQVFGFGVIAQALWMSESLTDDGSASADLAGEILYAKQTGDYSAFSLPDGSSPTNWGQFKKAILFKDKKNLGVIVSGHANEDMQDHGNGKNKDHGNNKDKNKNHP